MRSMLLVGALLAPLSLAACAVQGQQELHAAIADCRAGDESACKVVPMLQAEVHDNLAAKEQRRAALLGLSAVLRSNAPSPMNTSCVGAGNMVNCSSY